MMKSLDDKSFQIGLKRAVTSYQRGIVELLRKYPETIELTRDVRRIKEYSIKNNDKLLKTAMSRLEENGANVYYAANADDARKIIREIVGDSKIIVKSKSMTSEEIDLRDFLINQDMEVWETDLGEFIIQLDKSKPMHIVTPSLHIPREKVAKLFEELMGQKFDPDDIEGMVRGARYFLREKYFTADCGITGANVVAAEDGAILIIENEGNAKLTYIMPKKHIVLVGIEKIVPNLLDAMKVALVTWRYAKYEMAAYVNIIFGPSKSFLFGSKHTGVNGPEELHVVFLDNGRKEMMKSKDFLEATYCLRCGACIYECTVFSQVAGYFGGKTYMSGIGTIWSAFTEGLDQAIPAAYTCLLDARCRERCPISVDVPSMIIRLRRKIVELDKKGSNR